MRVYWSLLLLVCGLAVGTLAQPKAKKTKIVVTPFQELATVEMSFAQTAKDKGTRTAFLENLADNGFVFAPRLTDGKKHWQARAETPSLLDWQPKFVDVAASGSLGYTTGDWQFSPNKTAEPTAFGQYVTLWKRANDNSWKAIVDIGITHDKPASSTEGWTSPTVSSKLTAVKILPGNLMGLETKFSQTANTQDLAKAYVEFAHNDIRLLRDNNFPYLGQKAALEAAAKIKKSIDWKTMGFGSSADLAYVYGEFEAKDNNKVEKGNFLRIWKFDGQKWLIALDLTNDWPKEAY
jgi:hypothetical protein